MVCSEHVCEDAAGAEPVHVGGDQDEDRAGAAQGWVGGRVGGEEINFTRRMKET